MSEGEASDAWDERGDADRMLKAIMADVATVAMGALLLWGVGGMSA